MERPIFTNKTFLNLASENFTAMVRAFSIVLTLTLIQNFAHSQVNCNTILACSDGVQISLDDDCNMIINPYMMMPAYTYHADSFDVEAVLPNGTALPQFTVGLDTRNRPIKRVSINRSHIGKNLKVKVSLRGCSNACWGFASIEDKLPPVVTDCPCEERITYISNVISTADTSFFRPLSVAPCANSNPVSVGFKRHFFALTTNSIVNISVPNLNVKLNIYSPSFDPANPCDNVIAANINNFSAPLTAGTQYVLVISTNGAPSVAGEAYQVYMDSREGILKSTVAASVCERSCGDDASILAETATNAPQRPTFADGCSGAMWTPSTFFNGTINFRNDSIILTGGSNMGSTGVQIGAQICYTPLSTQIITYDWSSTLPGNSATDGINYSLGTSNFSFPASMAGTNVSVNIPGGTTFCFKVNTDNAAPDNVLTFSNVRVSPIFPALTYTKTDSVTILPCHGQFGKIIRRQWTAKDASGNVSLVKTQYFYIRRGSIETITCPANYIHDCSIPFVKLPSGAPDPVSSGRPGGIDCENMQVFYDDVLFDLCGAGIKVLRKWTIIDWCTGRDTICNQEIKIEDKTPPAVTCPADITSQSGTTVNPAAVIPVSPESCTATWSVIPPIAVFDCSKITWEVAFKKADTNGNPPAGAPFITDDGKTKVNGTRPVFADTLSQSARPYTITGLPLGRTWLRYTVTDTCGNSTFCFTEIDVIDQTPPTAICEDETIVSIDDTGWGVLKATSLDDHSNDNCSSKLRFEVRRKNKFCPGYPGDTIFRSEVRFCCSDAITAESYQPVVLRVYDEAGNYNDCETTVKVQNKRPPQIFCPSGRSLVCGDPKIDAWVSGTLPFDTAFFGKPTVSGVCAQLEVASRIKSNNINPKCNSGTVTREWYLVSNPNVKCDQILTITPPVFNAGSVVFPNDTVLATCDLSKAKPDFINSKPIVDKLGCRDAGISYIDQEFWNIQEACVKIIRTWKVIDWCSYSQAPFIAEKTQKILLKGNGPVELNCNDRTITAATGKCDTLVTLSVDPEDDCTDEEEWKYSWTLDLYDDKVNDDAGNTKSTIQNLPVGTHVIKFTVTNLCGIQSTCTQRITIQANKPPTPVCLGEIVWVMDPTKSTEVWASDFIQSASTNICGRPTEFDYYIFKKEDTNIVFTDAKRGFRLTCDDIPNGQVARIRFKVYVRDRNTGLFDYCDVTLILQDSPLTNACVDNPSGLPSISGRITTDKNEGIEEIEVSLKNMRSSSEIKSMTQKNGEYKLTGVDVFDQKSIGAYKNDDVLNGVSTLDLVMIQRHILGIQKIESPYKLLAADVNNSRSVTAGDLVSLRKLVLGVTNEFDNNTSWRFVPSSYKFDDPTNPFDYPFKVNLDSLYEDKNNVNFTAVKVGDVNGSVAVNAVSTEIRSGHTLFTTEEFNYGVGEVVKYEVKAGEDMHIIGTQFGFAFDANQLQFVGVSGGAFEMKSHHFNPFNAAAGKLSFSYDIAKGKVLKSDDVLFTIEFKALANGNTKAIKLDQTGMKSEVYETDGSVHQLVVQNRDKNTHSAQNILYQNEPNPFKESTSISFELVKSESVRLRILDLTGKLIHTQMGNFEKGFNSIVINNTHIGKSGIYYYQIEAGEFTTTKKMILIE